MTRKAIAFCFPIPSRDRTFINPTYIYLIALSKVNVIAVLKFNQQGNGDRINKNSKNQMTTVNNNQFSALNL
jgi:hypothetical protein